MTALALNAAGAHDPLFAIVSSTTRILTFIDAITYNYSMRGRDMYSVKDAAGKLGLSTNQVRHLLAKGEIQGKKLGHDWVVLDLNYQRRRKPKTRR